MENIVTIVGLLLGGGGIGFYFNYLISNRKTDHDEFRLLLETWKNENNELKEREKKNSERIHKLIEEVGRLKTRLIILSLQAGVSTDELLRDLSEIETGDGTDTERD